MKINLRISKKLTLGFAVMIVLIIATGIVSYVNILQINNANDFKGNVESFRADVLNARRYDLGYQIGHDQTYIGIINSYLDDGQSIIVKMKTQATDPTVITQVDKLATTLTQYKQTFGQESSATDETILAEFTAQGKAEVAVMLGSTDVTNANFGGIQFIAAFSATQVQNITTQTTILIVGFIIASVAIAVPLALVMIRSIQRPIQALVEDTKIIAAGDLSHQISSDRKDEIGDVISAVKTMVVSIKDLVGKVKTATETVASMSQEVGSTAEEVNAGMEQVTTATQNISTGAQKLSTLAQEVSKNINTLSSVLQETGGKAAEGMKFGEQSTEIMKQIQNDSAKASTSIETMQNVMLNTAQTVEAMHSSLGKIGELANMVTDVASQTEMLALNAAIEAARAGEAGRGFAVVADAVKELSDQSSNAANETLQSVSQVKKKGEEALEVSKQSTVQATEGAATVKASIEGTKSVAEAIEKINTMLTEVGKGVEQGVVAVEQVVKAIDEVSAISQESASASEENSSAMEEQAASMNQLAQTSAKLSEVASQLQKEIDKFKV
jgi:methyl-accepting chemotaxis protein